MKNRTRNNRNRGFTLVEVLLVVGIVIILLGVSMVSVVRYIDVLKITELDNAARDIFMALENRAVLLSAAQRLDNDLGVDAAAGSRAISTKLDDVTGPHWQKENEKLYYVSKAVIGNDLLAYGGIDPALLNGDFYVVYDWNSGSVTDVFYAEKSKTDTKPLDTILDKFAGFTDKFAEFYRIWDKDRSTRLGLKNSDKNPNRTLVGWYNGEASGGTSSWAGKGTDTPEKPYIDVLIKNGEELTVTVMVKWDESIDPAIRGALGGNTSIGELVVELGTVGLANKTVLTDIYPSSGRVRDRKDPDPRSGSYVYSRTWVLDSLADADWKFDELPTSSGVIPGDDFMVRATIRPNPDTRPDLEGGLISFIEASAEDKNNSLFWDDKDKGCDSSDTTAYIKYLRHLQNLSADETNINGYDSGVGISKTLAVQVDDIWGDGSDGAAAGGSHNPYVVQTKDGDGHDVTLVDYRGYKFVPIVNDALKNYSGKNGSDQYEIRNLDLFAGLKYLGAEDAECGAPIGLFSTVSKGSKPNNVELSNIHLVNTTMAGEGETVGALAGAAADVKIDGCWVYWDEAYVDDPDSTDTTTPLLEKVLGSDKPGTNYKYQLRGTIVGGLVGQAGGTTTITKSLAATLIKGSSAAGGLVGQWDGTNSTGITDISKSYADCYLIGDGQVAGLVGDVVSDKTVTLKDCYSAGFIVGAGTSASGKEQSAGLCLGLGTTEATNVYSVMVRPGTAGTSTPAEPTASNHAPFTNVHFLGDGTAMTGDGFVSEMNPGGVTIFESKTVKTAVFSDKQTYPYYLEKYLRDRQADEGNMPYEYPGLVGLPHYGDWGKAPLSTIGLVYYEESKVEDQPNSIWGAFGLQTSGAVIDGRNTMKASDTDGKTIVKDGYAVAFLAEVIEAPMVKPDRVRVEYYEENGTRISLGEDDDTFALNEQGSWDGKNYLIPLPEKLVKADAAPSGFYRYLRIRLYDADRGAYLGGGEFYYNPHFPNTVKNYTSDKPEAPEQIDIRTPRHLYHLSQFKDYYHTSIDMTYTFNQVLNLNFLTYTGYGLFVDEKENEEGERVDVLKLYVQRRIGTSGGAFNGTYDAGIYDDNKTVTGTHTISGLRINGDTYQGLFGYNSGVIKNVKVSDGIVESTSAGNAYVGGIVGYNFTTDERGIVENCTYIGEVRAKGTYVGGIVGQNCNGTVKNCTSGDPNNINKTIVTGNMRVGGIVGLNYKNSNASKTPTVEFCNNYAQVTGSKIDDAVIQATGGTGNFARIGGIAGLNNNASVKNCHNYGIVSAVDGYAVGGIVGLSNDGGSVEGCINKGQVVGKQCVGGIVGYNANPLKAATENYGSVTGDQYVGGIVGFNTSSGKVGPDAGTAGSNPKIEIYNHGQVTGIRYVGGIVGRNTGSGTVVACENSEKAQVTGTCETDLGDESHTYVAVGGIVGINAGTSTQVMNCKNQGTVSVPYGGTRVGGVVGSNGGSVQTGEKEKEDGTTEPTYSGYYGGTVKNCGNGKSVEAANSQRVGGIVGVNYGGTVEGCTNGDPNGGTGIKVKGLKYVGGIAGFNYGSSSTREDGVTTVTIGKLYDCTNHASVEDALEDSYKNDDKKIGIGSHLNKELGKYSTVVGGIAGQNSSYGTMSKCMNNGQVSSPYGNYVGGIVGYNTAAVGGDKKDDGCMNNGQVQGLAYVGGIAGYNSLSKSNGNVTSTGTVTYCVNNNTVTSNAITGQGGKKDGVVAIGGIVGWCGGGTVESCTNNSTGTVTYEPDEKNLPSDVKTRNLQGTGGIIGIAWNLVDNEEELIRITNCHNYAEVKSHGRNVGGITGTGSHFLMTGCTNNNVIEGNIGQNADDFEGRTGGILGYNARGIVDRCINTEQAQVKGTKNVGGIVGYNAASISATNELTYDDDGLLERPEIKGTAQGNVLSEVRDCTNYGKVEGTSNNVGGIVGNNNISSTFGNNVTVEELKEKLEENEENRKRLGDWRTWDGWKDKGWESLDQYEYTYEVESGTLTTKVSGCTNKGDVEGEGSYVGGIVGYNSISNPRFSDDGCSSKTTVTIGGINLTLTISGCTNNGKVEGTNNYVGGIVGYGGSSEELENPDSDEGLEDPEGTESGSGSAGDIIINGNHGSTITITDSAKISAELSGCENTGSVSSEGNRVGGIIGHGNGSTFTLMGNSNAGKVEGGKYVGGIVGYNTIGTLGAENKKNRNRGEVSGNESVGGIVGYNRATVNGDYNKIEEGSEVSGGSNIGGFVGENAKGLVENCVRDTGTVIARDENSENIGGIVGKNSGKVYSSQNNADLDTTNGGKTTGGSNVGGIVGLNETGGQIGDENRPNVNNANITGGSNVGGIVGTNNGANVFNGHSSTSGNVTGTGDNVGGVVGYNNGGHVKDFTGTTGDVTGQQNVGGIVGYNNGSKAQIENCGRAGGTVSGTAIVGGIVGYNKGGTVDGRNQANGKDQITGGAVMSSGWYAGGVVGYNDGSESKAVVQNYVTARGLTVTAGIGQWYIGGVVGYNIGSDAKVNECRNYGTVGTSEVLVVGGVVGGNEYGGAIGACYNYGSVYALAYFGGVAGWNEHSGIIDGCGNEADITGDFKGGSDVGLGGITGLNNNHSRVTRCYNTGTITNVSEDQNAVGQSVGGIVGLNNGDSLVENCYNTGVVYGDRAKLIADVGTGFVFVGGVVGANQRGATIQNCISFITNHELYEKNKIGGTWGGYAEVTGTVSNCYYLDENKDVFEQYPGEVPMSAAEFSGRTVLEKLGSSGVWVQGDQYPILDGVHDDLVIDITAELGTGADTAGEDEPAATDSGPEQGPDAGMTQETLGSSESAAVPEVSDPMAEPNDPSVLDPDPVESEPKDPGQTELEVPEPPKEPEEQTEDPVPEPEPTDLPPKLKESDDSDEDEPDPEPGFGPDPEPEEGPEL